MDEGEQGLVIRMSGAGLTVQGSGDEGGKSLGANESVKDRIGRSAVVWIQTSKYGLNNSVENTSHILLSIPALAPNRTRYLISGPSPASVSTALTRK